MCAGEALNIVFENRVFDSKVFNSMVSTAHFKELQVFDSRCSTTG
jgi:hypothetical protein